MEPEKWFLLRRVWQGEKGCCDVCQDEEGMKWIRLDLEDTACQREYLASASVCSSAKTRLDRQTLEILFPYQDGLSFRGWIDAEKPDLRRRRDACLAVLAHCLEDRPAPVVLAPAARMENLRFSQKDAWLLYLPNWQQWRTVDTVNSIQAVAVLCQRILTEGISPLQARLFPIEVQLVCLRSAKSGYASWEQLQQDLSAIPDCIPTLAQRGNELLCALNQKTRRFRKPMARIITAVLTAAALASLVCAFLGWRQERRNLFPGMTPIGDQQLVQESEEP